jgi:GTP-binding protein Era
MAKKADKKTKCGYAAIIGAPNAGKSTLLNKLVGRKISIVSQKVQTTRMRVLGLVTEKNAQICFIDTPGIFQPKRRLDKAMVGAAWLGAGDADVVLLMVDAGRRQPDPETESILKTLQSQRRKVALIVNKIDKVDKAKLLPIMSSFGETGLFEEVFPISAQTGDGLKDLLAYLEARMPEGPWLYDEDQLSDQPERLLAAEITREQLYRQLQQELPYAALVVPMQWTNLKNGDAKIKQKIIVGRESHKPIVLGKGGARIKSIGQTARKELESVLGRRVHLELTVAVEKDWQEKPESYALYNLEEKRR